MAHVAPVGTTALHFPAPGSPAPPESRPRCHDRDWSQYISGSRLCSRGGVSVFALVRAARGYRPAPTSVIVDFVVASTLDEPDRRSTPRSPR